MQDSSDDLYDLAQRGYRFALSLTHDAGQAEDLIQDAWFAVLQAEGPWNRGYLFAAVRTRFIDQCRRDRRRDSGFPIDRPGEVDRAPTTDFYDDDVFAVNGTLGEALERLRPAERAVLYLAAVEAYTAQQIADVLAWPRGTVQSMLHRAKTKLREQAAIDSGLKT